MELRAVSRFLAVLVGLLAAAPSLAQQGAITPPAVDRGHQTRVPAEARTPNYGTTNLTYVRVSGLEFSTLTGGTYGQRLPIGRFPRQGDPLVAAVHVPTGSIIDYLEIDFCDNADPEDILLSLNACDNLGTDCNAVANVNSFGAPGCSAISTSGFNHQVSNLGNLFLNAFFQLSNDGSALALMGAVVGYRLQVSPPPATATFNDVPTSDSAFQFIEALVASGITAGCGGGNYCPDAPLTRRQMAVFLSKALGLQWP
jgi:hypothetical protein